MDRADALSVLGLEDGVADLDVRSRYLSLLREHHPDVAGVGSTARAATITEAYRTLRITTPLDRIDDPAVDVRADGDTLVMGLPPDEAFLVLLDVAASVGDVTYVDPESGLLETILTLSTGVTCSLVMSLQGRAATGSTDAFCTLHPRAGGPAPPVAAVVAELTGLVSDAARLPR